MVLAPGSAHADDQPITTIAVGPLLTGAFSGRSAFGAGLEASLMHFPGQPRFGYGAFVHAQVYVREPASTFYGAFGLQGAWQMFGAELGVAGRTGGAGYGGALDAHFGVFVSLGYVAVLGGLDVPMWSEAAQSSYGVEGTISLAIKWPFGVQNSWWDEMSFAHGRLLRVEGRGALPGVVAAESGRGKRRRGTSKPNSRALDAAARRALGEAWLQDARAEHASVGAFARLSLQLLALGAPAPLLARCHQAALDEVGHAEQCFALAGEYLGISVDAGALPHAAVALGPAAASDLAWETFVDGCVGEGAAARALEQASREAANPKLRALLARIARDEAAHADLAWDIFAFCASRCTPAERETLRARVSRTARAPSMRPTAALPHGVPTGAGRVRDAEAGRILRSVRRQSAERAAIVLDAPARPARPRARPSRAATATAATPPRA